MCHLLQETCEVIIRDRVVPEDVVSLAAGDTLALVIHNFYPKDACAWVSERLLRDHRLGGYETADGAASIKKLGTPLFEVAGQDPARLEHYYRNSLAMIQALRQLSRPFTYPMDQLRLTLQEAWPAGAGFEVLHSGRTMNVGMPRVFEEGAAALPHVDRLAWDVPGTPIAGPLNSQWAANVHLRTADLGGELELWRLAPTMEQYTALRQTGSYGLNRARLQNPDAVITPQVGDLILFNSTRIHAVRACQGQPRVTVSSFIGYRGLDRPLSYWS